MTVRVRFAPSPTGYLHIGSARTALFNYLFAKHNKGKYLLRIEDTDRERSTPEAIEAIFSSLNWLGLQPDEEPIFQFSRAERHAEVAHELLKKGHAYYCYCSPEELQIMRDEAAAKKLPPRYNGMWRDRDPATAPATIKPVIRFKSPQEGSLTINDHVQGAVTVQNNQLDDMVLLRADGTPTYMLSVVVDDHDMEITHIIRGDDHLNNAFRQYHIYAAMGWDIPEFAHIPLIHGADGAKLSKRHGATSADVYKDMGFLAESMKNYLLRLGWAHGNDEIINEEQAIEWFSLEGIGRSPARFDMAKLHNLNGHYIRHQDDESLFKLTEPFIEKALGYALSTEEKQRILQGMSGLKERAKTLIELGESAVIYVKTLPLDEKATALMTPENISYLNKLLQKLEGCDFSHDALEAILRSSAEEFGIKLGQLASPLRVAITGQTISPSLFEVMEILGKEESLKRIQKII
ncbi:MAG: glutamate--tRNA ligase [Pseudomonadota bacterium]|jgi:glutamyl-tRNA synthetase|nr:glutamate--tRNA ligase [Alphaproteobacteria bacterium]